MTRLWIIQVLPLVNHSVLFAHISPGLDTPKSFINQQSTAIFESSTSEKIENINGIEDIDMSTLSPTKSTTR